MATYDSSTKSIKCSDNACLCDNCILGDFQSCKKFTHRLIFGKISKSKQSNKHKDKSSNFTLEEDEFKDYAFQWAKKIETENLKRDECYFEEDNGKNDSINQTNEEREGDSPMVIEDDAQYWRRCEEFKKHLKGIFEDNFSQNQLTNSTIHKLNFSQLHEAWTVINMETGNENDFHLFDTENHPILRSHFQQCAGRDGDPISKWFSMEMIDAAMENIKYRNSYDNQTVIILNCKFFYLLQVS